MLASAITLEKGALPDWAKNKAGFAQFDVKSTIDPYRKVVGCEESVRDANKILDGIEEVAQLLSGYTFSGTFLVSISSEKQLLTGQGIILGEDDYRDVLCLFSIMVKQTNRLLSLPLRLCQVSLKYSQLATLRE